MTTAKRRERKNAYWRENKPTVMAARSLESMKREREEAAREVRQRLSQRDADYAASPCAAPVTV